MDIEDFIKQYKGKKVRINKPDSSRYGMIGIVGGIVGYDFCSVLTDDGTWRSYRPEYLIPIELYKVTPLPLPG